MTSRKDRSLLEQFEEWANGPLGEALARLPERRESFQLEDGFPVERLYTPLDLEGIDYAEAIGFPGRFPRPSAPVERVT